MSKTELLKQLEAKRTRCQVWTRVMGYLRNTDNFNIGKKVNLKNEHFLLSQSVGVYKNKNKN